MGRREKKEREGERRKSGKEREERVERREKKEWEGVRIGMEKCEGCEKGEMVRWREKEGEKLRRRRKG